MLQSDWIHFCIVETVCCIVVLLCACGAGSGDSTTQTGPMRTFLTVPLSQCATATESPISVKVANLVMEGRSLCKWLHESSREELSSQQRHGVELDRG